MSDLRDIQVGDTIWLQDNSPRYRSQPNPELREAKVERVGRYYLYVKVYGREKKFDRYTGDEHVGPNDNGHYAWVAWRYKEEYERSVEEAADRNKMEAFFRHWNKPKELTHEQVKSILTIIEP